MTTMILSGVALAAAGFALSLTERTGAPKAQRRKPEAVAARIAQAILPVGLFAAAFWGDYQAFAFTLAAGWLVGALVGTVSSVARWGGLGVTTHGNSPASTE